MTGIPQWLLRHTVMWERHAGVNAHGPVYDPPVEIQAFVLRQPRVVRDVEGREVTCPATVYTALDHAIQPNDRITLDGRRTTVRQVTRHDGGGLPTPDHCEIAVE